MKTRSFAALGLVASSVAIPLTQAVTSSPAHASTNWGTCGGNFGGITVPSGAVTPSISKVTTIKREQHRTVVTWWTRLEGRPCHFSPRVSYGYPNYTEKATRTKLVLRTGTPSTASPYAPGTRTSYTRSRQVMVADHTTGTTGTWARYEYKLGRGWVKLNASSAAKFGRGGVVAASIRRQGTNTTPAGTFDMKYAFGEGNPGTKMNYRRISRTSVWIDRPYLSDYGRWRENGNVSGSGQGEDLSHYRDLGLYRQAAVIGYNYDSPVRYGNGSGSGIFLHFARSYTGGCVGLNNRTELNNTIRWMDPAKQPVMVIKA